MDISFNDVAEKIKEHFNKVHPELIITKRIENKLGRHVLNAISDVPDMTKERFEKAVCTFLSGEGVVSFVLERQPCVTPASDEVMESIKRYFASELNGYEPISVYRKSNHPDDSYLYMVSARNANGYYACWTSFNTTTESLNYGHYNLSALTDCDSVLEEYFDDITDEPEKYGMKSTKAEFESQDNVESKGAEDEKGEVISIYRRKTGR